MRQHLRVGQRMVAWATRPAAGIVNGGVKGGCDAGRESQ